LTYWGVLPEHPIPETMQVLCLSRPASEIAALSAVKIPKFPHPGHHWILDLVFSSKGVVILSLLLLETRS
jgi:hypothetical protein